MKTSIITVCLNSVETIEDAIKSVLSQSYNDIEYIVVDGGSADGTLEIIEKYRDRISQFISEPDHGIYDAMNKGIGLATGEIIGILNSDDYYPDEFVIEKVARVMCSNNTDSCHGDVVYICKNHPDKIVRYWKGGQLSRKKFKMGWMPHHGTFYVRKNIYMKYGLFRNDFPIAADYELILRFLYKHRIRTTYLPEILLKIRTGGASRHGILNTSKMFIENYRACKINGLEPSLLACFLKRLLKIPQYIIRPR